MWSRDPLIMLITPAGKSDVSNTWMKNKNFIKKYLKNKNTTKNY